MEKFQKQGIKQKTQHTTYSRYEECCVNCRQTSFSLPIPITATPEFTSKVGKLALFLEISWDGSVVTCLRLRF